MEKRSRTEITIETDRTFIITRRAKPSLSWCTDCAQPSRMVNPDDAVHLTGLTSRDVYRALETGKVHFIETHAGLVLFCLNSLSLLRARPVPADIKPNHLRAVQSPALTNSPDVQHSLKGLHHDEIQVYKDATQRGVIWENDGLQGAAQPRRAWVLTPEAFEKLLGCLDENRERAAETYEKIRRRLMKYFECRGCGSPEEHADETIDRVARRISEGKEIWTSNPASYFYGVARNVLKEYWNSPERETLPLECLSQISEPCEQPAGLNGVEPEWPLEEVLQALEHSMRALSAESRDLILEYYQGEKGDKIRNRQNIAKRLGVPANALRIRVHRIREKLERNVSGYLGAMSEIDSNSSHKELRGVGGKLGKKVGKSRRLAINGGTRG